MSRLMLISITLAAVATLTACSGSTDKEAGDGAKGATDAAPSALSGESGLALAADCSAKLKSVSKLYGILAKQSSGSDAEDLATRATQREAAATAFAGMAEQIAGTIGKTPGDAAQAVRDADAAVQAEFDKREFEDFATWVTGEVDGKCREALASQS
ncbi:hypothetical protein [Sphingopyxis sp. PET50]|uniref:hypothetical protein n=1 Tax=Sphingopyxis sp. PET50 TaxID=2976533 RepID=UPI0021AFB1F7|nr:hypothetical protein [Sphingopyxis sp. PET50]